MIIIDCSDYGPVGPYIADREEMSNYLAFAELMIQTHSDDWLDSWVDRWEMALAWDSVMEEVGEAWYSRCMLLQTVQGLRGRRVPKVQVISR